MPRQEDLLSMVFPWDVFNTGKFIFRMWKLYIDDARASYSFSIYGAADSSCDVFGKGGMGFRDLSCFKMALLARQGWQIMTHPDAFWVRILQGRDFPNSDFMQARRGSYPSWGWSSILSARSVLEKGVWVQGKKEMCGMRNGSPLYQGQNSCTHQRRIISLYAITHYHKDHTRVSSIPSLQSISISSKQIRSQKVRRWEYKRPGFLHSRSSPSLDWSCSKG